MKKNFKLSMKEKQYLEMSRTWVAMEMKKNVKLEGEGKQSSKWDLVVFHVWRKNKIWIATLMFQFYGVYK